MADAQSLPQFIPDALEALPDIAQQLAGKDVALFIDLDGTLAPIEARPDLVEVPAATRSVLEDLSRRCPVAIVSGRGLDDLRDIVGIRSLYYVADHGFQILGPLRSGLRLEVGGEYRPQLEQAAMQLRRALGSVEGALVEEKGLSLSVHYRLVPETRRAAVLRAVADVAESFPALRVTEGKLLYEFRPPGDWNKGKALLWLAKRLGTQQPSSTAVDTAERPQDCCPIALGDDLTDEDMFAAVEGWGIAVFVGETTRPTLAGYRLRDHLEVARFLAWLAALLPEEPAGPTPRGRPAAQAG